MGAGTMLYVGGPIKINLVVKVGGGTCTPVPPFCSALTNNISIRNLHEM